MRFAVTTRPRFAPGVEFVERKGTGHPDTLCDALAESLGCRLAGGFIEHTGQLRHFNVDKALLSAGEAYVVFGGGRQIRPTRIVLAGKGDLRAWLPDLGDLAAAAVDDLAALLPDADVGAFEVEVWLSQSASDLLPVLAGHAGDVPLANDTSFAVVSLPRSPLEEAVHQVEVRLNSAEFRRTVPVGRDIKVMGSRLDGETRITVAAAMLAGPIPNHAVYLEAVDAVRREAQRVALAVLGDVAAVAVNQADGADSPYLTLSGSSAEAGDDGQVGRGNRFGGLITPYRPMSLEASAGKNPAAHVGKTYHAVAHDIATRLVGELGAGEVTVRMLSRIGNPVTEPEAVHVETVHPVSEADVAVVVGECLADWRGVTARILDGFYELF